MPGLRGLEVDAPEGKRCEVALSLLESGDGQVSAGGVILWRHRSGPRSDGRIHVEVQGSTDPGLLTAAVAEAEFQRGLAQVEAMAGADVRFASLIARFGVVR